MNARELREPTENQLRAMAYVDGELSPEEALQFEALLGAEPALAREVVELRALELVARQMAPPEPMDHEWERLRLDPVQRAGVGVGFALILFGSVGLAGWACWSIAASSGLPLAPKCFVLGTIIGLTLVFLTVLRGRLRTLPYDPYIHVKR